MHTLSIKEALSFGWEKTKKHFWFLVAVMVGTFAVSLLVNFGAGNERLGFPLGLIAFLVSVAIGVAVEIGRLRITLKILDDVRGGIEDFLPNWDMFRKMLVTSVLQGLIVLAGLILLIVPGIIWGLRYYFATYFVVDKGLAPREALRASAKMMEGNKWRFFLFNIVVAGVILLGVIALGIGLLWAIPTVMIATAHIYRKLSE